MGTTVTPNLGLIKPDLNESIKANGPMVGWAAQNTINMDKLDALFRSTNSTWVLTWTGDTTNPTLGAGSLIEGKFLRLWPKMVIGYIRIHCGTSGFVAGSGVYRLTAPVAIAAGLMGVVPIGKAMVRDDSAALSSQLLTLSYDTTSGKIVGHTLIGAAWAGPATPMTMANNDKVSGYFMYPTDAA